jgi:3-methylcrotonyl-CoA carboxylase alpha subunit
VHIGPSPARESYLVGEKIIAAARETGAEAIHPAMASCPKMPNSPRRWPGRADLGRPAPHSIRAMGLKDAAKKLMAEAGVPVTPGYLGEDQDPKRLAKARGRDRLSGTDQGGCGRRRQGHAAGRKAQGFRDALVSCQREAASSFGNDHVLIEKYIQQPRHIEVQVFGDSHGNVVHLFERDCSLQRRHQKVIEEAPAPGMDAATREAICAAAVRAAKAVDYVGAGTIEFMPTARKACAPTASGSWK